MTFARSLLLAVGSLGLLAACGHSAQWGTPTTATPAFATAVVDVNVDTRARGFRMNLRIGQVAGGLST